MFQPLLSDNIRNLPRAVPKLSAGGPNETTKRRIGITLHVNCFYVNSSLCAEDVPAHGIKGRSCEPVQFAVYI